MRGFLGVFVTLLAVVACSLPSNYDTEGIVVEPSGAYYRNFALTALPGYFSIAAVEATKTNTSAKADVAFFNIDAVFNKIATDFVYFEVDANIPQDKNSNQFINAALFAFRFRALSLLEYVERNGQAGFQYDPSLADAYTNPQNDFIVGYYNIQNAPFNPIEYAVHNFTNDAGESFKVVVASVTSTDGVFKFQVYAAGSPIKVNGTSAGPDTIKINFEINYFNNPSFTTAEPANLFCATLLGYNNLLCVSSGPSPAGTYPNSSLAVVTSFGAVAGTFSGNTDSSNPSLSYTSGTKSAVFAWESTSDVDYEDGVAAATVYHSVQDHGVSNFTSSTNIQAIFKIVAFSVTQPRPTTWTWDPSLGMSDSTSPTTTTSGHASSAQVVRAPAALVFAAIFLVLCLH